MSRYDKNKNQLGKDQSQNPTTAPIPKNQKAASTHQKKATLAHKEVEPSTLSKESLNKIGWKIASLNLKILGLEVARSAAFSVPLYFCASYIASNANPLSLTASVALSIAFAAHVAMLSLTNAFMWGILSKKADLPDGHKILKNRVISLVSQLVEPNRASKLQVAILDAGDSTNGPLPSLFRPKVLNNNLILIDTRLANLPDPQLKAIIARNIALSNISHSKFFFLNGLLGIQAQLSVFIASAIKFNSVFAPAIGLPLSIASSLVMGYLVSRAYYSALWQMIGPVFQLSSRQQELRTDLCALRMTQDPAPLIDVIVTHHSSLQPTEGKKSINPPSRELPTLAQRIDNIRSCYKPNRS